MKRAYWCFPQCVEAFKHCKPVISVDGAFLTGKYRGALLIVTGMHGEDRLIPLAFSLVEGETTIAGHGFCIWSIEMLLDRTVRCALFRTGIKEFLMQLRTTWKATIQSCISGA